MRRQICWKEKGPEGKTEVRVTLSKNEVKWQYKAPDEPWDYDTPPSPERWDRLEQELADRLQRGSTAIYELLEQVRRARRD